MDLYFVFWTWNIILVCIDLIEILSTKKDINMLWDVLIVI